MLAVVSISTSTATGQMRQMYQDNSADNNVINKLSFYSASAGYVSFSNFLGYTVDSGHTFIKKYITRSNVNYNGNIVNPIFAFGIAGVKAFNQNLLIVYGDYGLVPSILYSNDGGNTFELVYHSQYNPLQLSTGITDIVFPENNGVGYAIDADRILKTTDNGLTWSVGQNAPQSFFNHLEAVDNNHVLAMSTAYETNKVLITTNGGSTWQNMKLPGLGLGKVAYATFLTANKGWLSIKENDNENFYSTTDGGNNWTLRNDASSTPFNCGKMKFLDDSTGYALFGQNTVYKTTSGGSRWEPLPRDNNYNYLLFTHRDLQCLSMNHLWAGGGHGFLEMSTNGGGKRLPKAFFSIDTSGVNNTNKVKLLNYSDPSYQLKWYVNNILVSTAYNATYTHVLSSPVDSIKLVVTSSGGTDSLTNYQYFVVPVVPSISSFIPTAGTSGTFVTINGSGFLNVTSVAFGGISAAEFKVVSDNIITATVAGGATGSVTITDVHGAYSMVGFRYFPVSTAPPPTITSFTPTSGPAGTTIKITGTNFSASTEQNLVYFGTIKASVTAASTTSITCIVPFGTAFEPISIINSSTALVGSSLKPFNVTFADSSNFTGHSFTSEYSISYGEYMKPGGVMGTDIDGDGKPDLVSIIKSFSPDSLVVYRNTSSLNKISFSERINVAGLTTVFASGKFDARDIDGDGKPDIVAATNFGNVQVTRNTTSAGTISFSPVITVPTAAATVDVKIDDIDNDGKNDIVACAFDDGFVSVVRNTSIPGTLSFAECKNFSVLNNISDGRPLSIATGDIDGDGKKEIVVYSSHGPSATFSCFLNTGSVGNISLAHPIKFKVPGSGLQFLPIFLVDYDNDNKLDVVMANDDNYCIFRNISTVGNIAFAPVIATLSNITAQGGCISNLSGDGRPDLTSGDWNGRTFPLLKNTSLPGVIKNDNAVSISGTSPDNISVYFTNAADFNMDGKIDIVTSGSNDEKIVVFKNSVGVPLTVSLCVGSNSSKMIEADLSGTNYQWQMDSGSGFIDLSDNSQFSGTNKASLYLFNMTVSYDGRKIRCIVDGYYSSTFVLKAPIIKIPTVSISSTDSAICYGKPVSFTAVVTDSAHNHQLLWYVNGNFVARDVNP